MTTTSPKRGANGKTYAETKFARYAEPLVKEAAKKALTLADGAHIERLHELRVALRRLRTLLWAYRPMLDEKVDDQQRAVFKFLANAAGNTRDFDILIGLIESRSDEQLLSVLRRHREETAKKSRETLSNAHIEKVIREALHEANRKSNTSPTRTSLTRFARDRVTAAEKQLRKRIVKAAHARRSNYEAFHDVRKAGKKVRYLIEFFEPLLTRKQRKRLKPLKQLQKRFGALNDVVASRELLVRESADLPDTIIADIALKSLSKEEKRRHKAAAKLL